MAIFADLLSKTRLSAWFLAAFFALLAAFGSMAPASAAVLPLPAPTLLRPADGAILGQDKAWVGGLVKNNLLVIILVDGKEYKQTVKTRSHSSGNATFGVNLSKLSLGEHAVTAITKDKKGKVSAESNALMIVIKSPTSIPTLRRPVVNADSGIERPFIIGNIQNGLEVGIIIDGKLQTIFTPKPSTTKITSFAWQPKERLSLGKHLIEAFASDKGKLSNHDQIFWPVGEAKASSAPEPKKDVSVAEPATPLVKVSDNKPENRDEAQKLTMRQELKSPEKPVIPDAVAPVEPVADDSQGKIESNNEPEKKITQAPEFEPIQGEVKEVSPGAVVRETTDKTENGFKFNNSLIVGITILAFLLLSMVVWYVQERRDKLGEKVAGLFREDEGSGLPPSTTEPKKDYSDLPPPPPPMF